MLLLAPTRAALAMGVQCKNPDGSGDEPMLEMLRLITPRVEGLLNVKSLSAGTYRDVFLQPAQYLGHWGLRLTNAFLTDTPVQCTGVFGSEGEEILTPTDVDKENGILWFSDARIADRVEVTYTSGFTLPSPGAGVHADENYRVAENVPDWISGIVANCLTVWVRNQKKVPEAPKEYGFLPTLNEATLRDLRARVYERYMRQRHDVHWPLLHSKLS